MYGQYFATFSEVYGYVTNNILAGVILALGLLFLIGGFLGFFFEKAFPSHIHALFFMGGLVLSTLVYSNISRNVSSDRELEMNTAQAKSMYGRLLEFDRRISFPYWKERDCKTILSKMERSEKNEFSCVGKPDRDYELSSAIVSNELLKSDKTLFIGSFYDCSKMAKNLSYQDGSFFYCVIEDSGQNKS